MPIDLKTASHQCSAIKRLIQRCYPRLHIRYVLHKENEREKVFAIESRQLTLHPAGKYILENPNKKEFRTILQQNHSRFVCIAKQHSPGFLRFFRQKSYMALCFMNYERFDSVEHFRNHAYNIAWHAIALHNDHEKASSRHSKKNEDNERFNDDNNILTPVLDSAQYDRRNLLGDIFSACIQTIQGRKEAFDFLAKQRINSTLNASKGFHAEHFPFPMCIDTLEYVFKDNINQEKTEKHPVLAAVKITENIGKTYNQTSIEQWLTFSLPVQQMAWAGYDTRTILGAALYTSENTYAQSIADMIAERISIKPQIITHLQDYNPFTAPEANARMHRKLCLDLLYNLLARLILPEDHKIVIEVISKQNTLLLEGKVMSWCVPALIPIEELIRQCPSKDMMPDLLNQAMKMFEKEIDNIPWETLAHLSKTLFLRRRDNREITMQTLMDITAQDEELSSVHYGLSQAKKLHEKSAS
ncbi:MAG: hypothetical protein ACLFP8_00690 [Alphaproteobacteria bacterium]